MKWDRTAAGPGRHRRHLLIGAAAFAAFLAAALAPGAMASGPVAGTHLPARAGGPTSPGAHAGAEVRASNGGAGPGATDGFGTIAMASSPGTTPVGAPTRVGTGSAPRTPSGNLLTGSQATFAGSTGGWVGEGSLLSWSPSPSTTGAGSLRLVPNGSSWAEAFSSHPPDGTPTPTAPGARYLGEATANASGSQVPVGLALSFFDQAGQSIGTAFGQIATVSPGAWASLPAVAGVAPTTAVSMALAVIDYRPGSGQAVYVERPSLSALAAPSPVVVGPLHTAGNTIVQADGRPLSLRGVVLAGLERDPSSPAVTHDAVVQARQWGANFVRVPLGEQFWLPSNCDFVASYRSTVDQVVQWITSLGMVALLDLHTNTVGGCTTGKQHDMADAAQAPAFWSQVAGRYGNPSSPLYSPLVALDLYNEPHDISDAVWLNGGTVKDAYFPFTTYQAAGMQDLYDAVRAAGAPGLVFASGRNWANTPPGVLVNGNNVVYAVHYYTCQNPGASNCSSPGEYDPSPVLQQWVGLGSLEPVVVTEFGWPSTTDGTYVENVISYAEKHGWGWSAFVWQQANSGWALAMWVPDGTAEPNPSGVPVLVHLAGGT